MSDGLFHFAAHTNPRGANNRFDEQLWCRD
jgi:hypothetical protein